MVSSVKQEPDGSYTLILPFWSRFRPQSGGTHVADAYGGFKSLERWAMRGVERFNLQMRHFNDSQDAMPLL